MTNKRIIEWIILAATAGLLIVLKELHLGVTHYNLFLSILIGWCLLVIIAFRILSDRNQPESN